MFIIEAVTKGAPPAEVQAVFALESQEKSRDRSAVARVAGLFG
jgi:hypothetical protein